ncbi:MAG: amidohydrolase family protein, partial [Acidobacteriota bacterium]
MIARLSARPFVRPLAAAALLALLVGCAGPSPDDRAAIAAAVDGPADLVVRGGTILTVDDDWSEVEALAVRDGRIVARGTADAIAALIDPSTEIVELDGRVAMPGFIEGHGHFLGLGERRAILDLRAEVLPTWDAIVARVRAAAAEVPAGTWIRGRGW